MGVVFRKLSLTQSLRVGQPNYTTTYATARDLPTSKELAPGLRPLEILDLASAGSPNTCNGKKEAANYG